MHLTAPSHWSRSITSGRDGSERVVTIVVARNRESAALLDRAVVSPVLWKIAADGCAVVITKQLG